MEKSRIFVIKEEEYHFGFNAGDLYTGYAVSTDAADIKEPTKCLSCHTWFQEGQQGHQVNYDWAADLFDCGWDMCHKHMGHICQTCFDEAMANGQFLGAKLRP